MKINLSQATKIATPEDEAAASKKASAISYLNSTAWYAIRNLETGEPVPDDVHAQRTAAYETLKEAP